MCTLCLSEMDDLRDEWLRAPPPKPVPETEQDGADPGTARLEPAA